MSLDAYALLRDACRVADLDDYGDGWFREPLGDLRTLARGGGAASPARRLMARAEIQRILQNRLRIEDLWKREPSRGDERIAAPLVVYPFDVPRR